MRVISDPPSAADKKMRQRQPWIKKMLSLQTREQMAVPFIVVIMRVNTPLLSSVILLVSLHQLIIGLQSHNSNPQSL